VTRNGQLLNSYRFSGGTWVSGSWGTAVYANLQSIGRPECSPLASSQILCASVSVFDLSSSVWAGIFNGGWGTWSTVSAGAYGPPA